MTPFGCHRQKNQPLAASTPFGVLSLRLVPLVTNGTNGKIFNGTIWKTPNAPHVPKSLNFDVLTPPTKSTQGVWHSPSIKNRV